MAQKQLNLSPEAVMVLLEALSVLNLGCAYLVAVLPSSFLTFSAATGDASTSSAPAVSSNDANNSASSAVPAANGTAPPATQQGAARAHPVGGMSHSRLPRNVSHCFFYLVSASSALSATRPESSPVALRSPFTGFPHEVQPVASASSVTTLAQTPTPAPRPSSLRFPLLQLRSFSTRP